MRLHSRSTAATSCRRECLGTDNKSLPGYVVLCPEVVGDAWRAPLVHAVLHLVGYDHGAEMEAQERAHA